jgi:hypothetical protein
MKMKMSELKECYPSILIAIKNYQNRIKYLENQNKISKYKLNRIKSTTLYDLNKAEEYIKKELEND